MQNPASPTFPVALWSARRYSAAATMSSTAEPERQYYWFGEPIDTGAVATIDDRPLGHIRDQTKTSIEQGVAFLLNEQRTDPTGL